MILDLIRSADLLELGLIKEGKDGWLVGINKDDG